MVEKKEKTTKSVIRKKKVGSYMLKLYEVKVNPYWSQFFTEARKSNALIEKSGDENHITPATDIFGNFVDKYKKLAIQEDNYKFGNDDFCWRAKTSAGCEMEKVNKHTGAVVKTGKAISTFEGLVRAFIHNKHGRKRKVGNYEIIGDKLVYKGEGRNADFGEDIIALRLKNKTIIGNASKLPRCGSYRRGDEAPAQRVMFDMNIPLIPFNVFQEAKLDIQKTRIVERSGEDELILPRWEWDENSAQLKPVQIIFDNTQISKPKETKDIKILSMERDLVQSDKIGKKVKGWRYTYLDRTKLAKRHFVGAMLLQVKNKYFLFDVDRRELKFYRFNPFLAELPARARTIKEAYELLMPLEVRNALKKGLKVLRQGEWFFIPTKRKISEKKPALPVNVTKGIKNTPDTDKFNIGFWVSHGAEIDLKEKQKEISRVKKKYRASLIKRIKDYNKEIRIYQDWKRKAQQYESQFNFYSNGADLKAGNNRPNRVSKLYVEKGQNFVTGNVTHTGREHEPITLKGWHKAIPNTATKSFTITGSID